MVSRFICLPILTILLSHAVQAGFPDDPKPCPHGDSDCIIKFVNDLIGSKGVSGDDDIGLMKLEPFPVSKMTIKQGEDSPVNIDLTFTNNEVHGLSNLKMKKVKGFGKDLAQKHELLLQAESLSLVGPYEIKGQVLILPISGSGDSNMTLVNPELLVSFMGKAVEKDGATYMEVDDFQISSKPEGFIYYFSNLFNGDKALGDNMNEFLNENWHTVFLEVQGSMQKAFNILFKDIVSSVFNKHPYDKFFS